MKGSVNLALSGVELCTCNLAERSADHCATGLYQEIQLNKFKKQAFNTKLNTISKKKKDSRLNPIQLSTTLEVPEYALFLAMNCVKN